MHAPPPHFYEKQRLQRLHVFAFSVINVNNEHINQYSKGSLWVKFEGGIFAFAKLCLKIWF